MACAGEGQALSLGTTLLLYYYFYKCVLNLLNGSY